LDAAGLTILLLSFEGKLKLDMPRPPLRHKSANAGLQRGPQLLARQAYAPRTKPWLMAEPSASDLFPGLQLWVRAHSARALVSMRTCALGFPCDCPFAPLCSHWPPCPSAGAACDCVLYRLPLGLLRRLHAGAAQPGQGGPGDSHAGLRGPEGAQVCRCAPARSQSRACRCLLRPRRRGLQTCCLLHARTLAVLRQRALILGGRARALTSGAPSGRNCGAHPQARQPAAVHAAHWQHRL
jgi:hypothetical protein